MDDLEGLLRQFQPRRPRPLPGAERGRASRPLVWLALSGLAAAVVLMVSWRAQTPLLDAPHTSGLTLGALNAHAARSIDDLDDVLTRTSPVILPRVDRPGSVLYALAKE
jgi:hypothetical protein